MRCRGDASGLVWYRRRMWHSNRGTISCLAILLVGWFAGPAWGAWVLGQGQETKVKRLFSTSSAQLGDDLMLDQVEVDSRGVGLRFSARNSKSPLLWVTLVHPSVASQNAKVLETCAVESKPGPVDERALQQLVAMLKRVEPLLLWHQREEPPEAEFAALSAGSEDEPRGLEESRNPVRSSSTRSEAWSDSLRKAAHMVDTGEISNAIGVLDELRDEAITPWLLIDLATAYAQAGATEQSRAMATKALDTDADEVANALLGTIADIPSYIGQLPGSRRCESLETARSLKQAGRLDEAELWMKTLAQGDDCERATVALVELVLDRGRNAEALSILDASPHAASEEVLLFKGHILRTMERYQESLAILEPILRSDPHTHRRLFSSVLTMYLWLGHDYVPFDDWRRISGTNKEDLVTPFLLGAVLHYAGEYEESLQWLEPLYGRLIDVPRLNIYLAMGYFNLDGSDPRARPLLDEALGMSYVDHDVYYCRGEVLRDSDRQAAIDDFTRFLSMTTSEAYHHRWKAYRVKQMRDSLVACQQRGDEVCDGPFEHPKRGYATRHKNRLATSAGLAIVLCLMVAFYRRRTRAG